MQPCCHLDFSQYDTFWTFDLQNCKIINCVMFVAVGYRSNRKRIKWLNTPASSVLEWGDSEAYVLCWISEFLEVGIKCLLYSGTF